MALSCVSESKILRLHMTPIQPRAYYVISEPAPTPFRVLQVFSWMNNSGWKAFECRKFEVHARQMVGDELGPGSKWQSVSGDTHLG